MNNVAKMFGSVDMSREDLVKVEAARDKFVELANLIDDLVGDSREKSIAFTKLEEANMWTIKAIARDIRIPKHHD